MSFVRSISNISSTFQPSSKCRVNVSNEPFKGALHCSFYFTFCASHWPQATVHVANSLANSHLPHYIDWSYKTAIECHFCWCCKKNPILVSSALTHAPSPFFNSNLPLFAVTRKQGGLQALPWVSDSIIVSVAFDYILFHHHPRAHLSGGSACNHYAVPLTHSFHFSNRQLVVSEITNITHNTSTWTPSFSSSFYSSFFVLAHFLISEERQRTSQLLNWSTLFLFLWYSTPSLEKKSIAASET